MTNLRAVFRAREDGDFDFVAAFANDAEQWDGDAAETYAENLRAEGEEIIVKEFGALDQIPDVLTPDAGTPNGGSQATPRTHD